MEEMTYSSAMAELETIVNQIDNGELEIDLMTERIKRANELIEFCERKLTVVDTEIEKLLHKEDSN